MRVEIVQEAEGRPPAAVFPRDENYLDLRANPQAIEKIASARRYLPLRNFLAAVNGEKSMFVTADVSTKSDVPTSVSADLAYEFASQVIILFAEPSMNWEKAHYTELSASLKQLLEREPGDSVRTVLLISSCEFPFEQRRGFCLGIRLVADGESAQQAQLRWGLGLARVQQALLFRSRTLRQLIRE
jgi:hypothetical protein